MLEQLCDVLLTSESVSDVAEISAYIQMSFGRTALATFKAKWEKQLDFIAANPKGSPCTEHEYRGLKVHVRVFKPSLIFYTHEESVNTAVILRVLREESNWESILTDNGEYHLP